MNKLISLLAGIIFGTGLVISEMINPEKVLSFLNVFGNWDPSLAFVMIGALIVSSPLFHLIKIKKNLCLLIVLIIQKQRDSNRLIIGSALFGAGWGLGGLCPGPAISSIALLNINSIIFVFAMFIGFYLVKFFNLTKAS